MGTLGTIKILTTFPKPIFSMEIFFQSGSGGIKSIDFFFKTPTETVMIRFGDEAV